MSDFSSVVAYLMVLKDPKSLNKNDISSEYEGMKIKQSLSHLGNFMGWGVGGLQIPRGNPTSYHLDSFLC